MVAGAVGMRMEVVAAAVAAASIGGAAIIMVIITGMVAAGVVPGAAIAVRSSKIVGVVAEASAVGDLAPGSRCSRSVST
jgi:hypothetical protein